MQASFLIKEWLRLNKEMPAALKGKVPAFSMGKRE